jgi:putative spermidine/putrescine transport system permease protein
MMSRNRLNWVTTGIAFITAFILVSPILIAVAMSFTTSDSLHFPPEGFSLKWYQAVISEPKWQDRLPVSLEVAFLSGLIATTVSTLSAFALVRSKIRGKNLISTLFIAPLIVPVVVLGTGDFFVWANGWDFGSFAIGGKLLGTVLGLVLAHSIIAIPYPFVTVRASLVNVDTTLELAAKNLGATPVTTFTTITLPLILPGVLSGFIFAFIASWDEVVLASFISTSRVSTVPVQIFQQLRDSLDPSAAAISSLLLLVSVTLVSLLALAQRKQSQKQTE